MIQYPMTFSAKAQALAVTSDPWGVSASSYTATCNVPPEFGGKGGTFSPEDFYILAITNCFVATFRVFAEASKLNYEKIAVDAELVLDRTSPSQATAKECRLRVALTGVVDRQRALNVLNKVARSGILLNSIKTELVFVYLINGEASV